MSPSSMDRFASSDSTRVSSSSPSSTSSSFDPIVLNTTVPFPPLGNDYQPHYNASWSFDSSSSNSHNNNTSIAYPGGLFGSPHAATQQAFEAAVHQSPSPPLVQMHHLSLSSSPAYGPCGPVTYVSTSGLVAPQPVSSSPTLIGRSWPAPLQPPPLFANAFPSEPPAQVPSAILPRPPMQAKIPPEKGRKSFPCLHPGCGMKFPKRNALVQHMRSHTGERPEVCDWCSRAFSLKCNLRRHFRTCKKKKALEMAAKEEPSSSPHPPFEQSPSPGASSPSTTVVPTSHDSPPADMYAPQHNLWGPDFSFTPSHQAPTLVADLNCHTLFADQFTACPYTTLIQAQF